WVTGQFLAACRPPDELRFEVDRLVEGRNIAQATVVARVGGADVLAFQAALGARPATEGRLRSGSMPAVAPPDRCQPVEPPAGTGGLRPRFDGRSTPPRPGDDPATSRWWFRTEELADQGDPALLAVVLDFVPMALSASLGRPVFGASLDNTVRVVERGATPWVLAELTLDSLSDGIAHVTGRAWSDAGVLLAVGSQTCVVADRPG
ncbi:MAG: thioesterase family protein, partial [Acidimicrobiia bacterium]|nr:thioesterase family protein [Acidimicrobiia bacterium]